MNDKKIYINLWIFLLNKINAVLVNLVANWHVLDVHIQVQDAIKGLTEDQEVD